MAAWRRPVTPCVILLHRSGVPMVPVLGIQGVIKMTEKEFSRMEENSPLYYNFSDEKFMFKRTWQVVFWGARNYFRHPKTTCRSPEGSGRASLHSRCAWKRKIRNKKLKNDRSNIQSASQKMTTTEKKMNFIRVFNLPQPVFFHLPIQCRGIYFQ